MNRCKNCRWWDSEDLIDGRGVCLMAVNHYGDKDCYPREHPETLALARDCDGYGANLFTSPEFGCVQWQAKDAVTAVFQKVNEVATRIQQGRR